MPQSLRPSTVTGAAWSKPAVAIGDFVVLAGETFAAMLRRPFAWRELIEQVWFVARVSIVPTLVLSIPYTVLIVFTLNIVLIEVGAGDLSGAGAALASVTQVGPVVTAIVVSGAGSTAMCADLGARTTREEIDAMKVIGVNPIQALVVPRVIARLLVCVLPGCANPVEAPGDPCSDCLATFGGFLQPSDDAPLTAEQIAERDSYVTWSYYVQRQLRELRR